jgi:hypothetical protein
VKIYAVLFSAVACMSCTNAAETTPADAIPIVNGGFEQGDEKTAPTGWESSQHSGVRAYEYGIDRKSPGKGKASFRIHRTTPQVYGLIQQRVDATKLVGKTVEATALLRSAKVGKRGFTMFVNLETSDGGVATQVRSEPVVDDTRWTRRSVKVDVPEAVTTIAIGFILKDGGTGWADDVHLRTVEPTPASAEAPAPKTGG